jgi:hypothetical protein
MTNKKSKSKNSLVIEKKENIHAVKKYLIGKRNIDEYIINKFINTGSISADINNNCIFYNNDKTYAHLRGTNNVRFFSSIGKSDFIEFKSSNNPLYLFESPIDALSFMTLYNKLGNMISFSGEMMINKVDKLINKDITDIYLCFDNDEKGDEFSTRIKNILNNYKINFFRLKSKCKDWNEDLIKTNKKLK